MKLKILGLHSSLVLGGLVFIQGLSFGDLRLVRPKEAPPVNSWKGVKEPQLKKGFYALPTGFTFDAVLPNAIFSYNLVTPAIAVIEEDILFLDEVVLPKETRLIGFVQAVHSLDRVNVDFHTCVFPNGQEIPFSAMALSPDGSAGVVGKLETHKDAMAAKTAMRTIFSGAAVAASVSPVPTMGTAMAANLSQEAATTIDSTNVKELDSVKVEPKTSIKVFVHGRTEY